MNERAAKRMYVFSYLSLWESLHLVFLTSYSIKLKLQISCKQVMKEQFDEEAASELEQQKREAAIGSFS